MGKDTQIDELRLDITVNDSDKNGSSKKVENLATAISNLSKSISILNRNINKFDGAKFTNVLENITSGLDPLISKLKGVSKTLVSLATIVSKGGLDKAVKEVTGKVPELKTETYSDGDRKSEPIQAVQGQAEELQETTNKAKSLGSSILDITNKADILRKKLEMINAEMKKSGLSEKQLVQLKSQQLSIQEQIAKAEGKKPKVPLSNLLKSFGRIAMYRSVRRIIQEITQAFMESIDGITKVSPKFRNTMSQIMSDTAKLKASIGIGLYQVLILLAPTITDISNAVADFANNLSLSLAIFKKSNNYLKVNTEYWKEYQSAINGTLLSFDTFTTLNSSNAIDWDKMFIPSNVSDATEEEIANTKGLIATLETLQSILQSIGDTLSTLWGGIIKPILTSGATSFILEVVAAIVQFLDKAGLLQTTLIAIAGIWTVEKITGIISSLSKLGGVFTSLITKIQNYNLQCALAKTKTQILQQTWKSLAVAGVAVAVSVSSIISNWEDMSSKQKGWVIAIAAITGAVAALAFAVYAALHQWAKAISVAAGVITTGATVATAVAAFADGGIMEQSKSFSGAGTMYALAGESGAEVVATGSAGTGVLNVDQFADAMVSALVRYGAARDTGSGTTIVLDGNKVGQLVASNVGFRNEANRRNAGLNWK